MSGRTWRAPLPSTACPRRCAATTGRRLPVAPWAANHDRPHEALGQRPPIRRYRRSPRDWDGRLRQPEYAGDVQVRRVRANGEIKWKGALVFLSETLSGEPVGLRAVAADRWDI